MLSLGPFRICRCTDAHACTHSRAVVSLNRQGNKEGTGVQRYVYHASETANWALPRFEHTFVERCRINARLWQGRRAWGCWRKSLAKWNKSRLDSISPIDFYRHLLPQSFGGFHTTMGIQNDVWAAISYASVPKYLHCILLNVYWIKLYVDKEGLELRVPTEHFPGKIPFRRTVLRFQL